MPSDIEITVIGRDLIDARGYFTARFDAQPGTAYLLRPGPACLRALAKAFAEKIAAARDRALARNQASGRHSQ